MSISSKHIHIFRGFPSTSQCRNTQGKSWELFGRHPKSVDGLWDSHASHETSFRTVKTSTIFPDHITFDNISMSHITKNRFHQAFFRSKQNLLTLHPRLSWHLSTSGQDFRPNTPTYRCSNASQRDLRCITAPRARPVPYNCAAELVTNAPRQSSNPTWVRNLR